MAAAASARDVEQLWALARLLANGKQIAQATRCLELCVSAPPSAEIALQANILLAECCLALCQTESKNSDRERWWKRYKCAENAARTANECVTGDMPSGWRARLCKCKYLLAKFAKRDNAVKNRLTVQVLCDGVQCCDVSNDGEVNAFRAYFVEELRASLVKMHTETLNAPSASRSATLAGFEDNLKLVRTSMPTAVDASFQLWLIEVSCHVLVASSRFSSAGEANNALAFADRWISSQQSVLPSLKMYHLIVKCFSLLRSGEIKKLAQLVGGLKTLRADAVGAQGGSGLTSELFVGNIIDALDLEVTSRHDPCQAAIMSKNAIHQVQANLQVYATRPEIHLMLLGLLFDMLFIHCDLYRQQSRYYEMGVSIAQVIKLFAAYKHHLEPTSMISYYVGQIHGLIAKYAFAIGSSRDGEKHVQLVLQHYLPEIQPDDSEYPLHYVRVWVELLDATVHCSSTAGPAFIAAPQDRSNGIWMIQILPTVVQLNMAGRLLESPSLRAAIQHSGNVELRSRFQLALCKWLWATQEIHSSGAHRGLNHYTSIEQLRPDILRLLQESQEMANAHVNCTDVTAEIMTVFGPKLIEVGRPDNGEDTLKGALRLSLHAKNVLLQSRLLVEVFRLYGYRQLLQAQATTAEKYEKKIAVLHRRVTQAQAEQATNAAILMWSSVTSYVP